MLAASLLTSRPGAYGEKHAVPTRHDVFTGAYSSHTHRMQFKCTRMQFQYTCMQFKYTRISHVLMCAYELRGGALGMILRERGVDSATFRDVNGALRIYVTMYEFSASESLR